MQVRLLLSLNESDNFLPIIMWHLQTFHDHDCILTFGEEIDLYQINTMSSVGFQQSHQIKAIHYRKTNTGIIFVPSKFVLNENCKLFKENFGLVEQQGGPDRGLFELSQDSLKEDSNIDL